jgi:hypothetical protein
MRLIGFSTGALAKGDFRRALNIIYEHRIDVVEFSALRLEELAPLLDFLVELPASTFSFASIHAPSKFPREAEQSVVSQLMRAVALGYPVIVHPDVIYTPALWARTGHQLLIENMDKRKPIGRTLPEMFAAYEHLPEAGFCFDVGHARQIDPSMAEASALLRGLSDRLRQVHISEVNTASRHDPISLNAVDAFQRVARYIPDHVPIILETLIDVGQSTVEAEVARAREALETPVLAQR